MVSRKVTIYGVALGFLILGTLPFWIFREPSYRGQSLSEWLIEASSTRNGQSTSYSEAEKGICEIGPRAVPQLLRMLAVKETRLGEVYRFFRNEWGKGQIPSPWDLQHRAFVGLEILGPAAASAVPKIVELLEKDPGRMELWFLLEKIGPSSAVAAPLLDRAFPNLAKNAARNRQWNEGDFHPAWLANDLRISWGGSYRQVVAEELSRNTNALIVRVSCLWALRKDAEFARELMPTMVGIVTNGLEPPRLKIAALHALGRIPHPDEELLKRATEAYEAQFGPLAADRILNGDFRQSNWTGTNQMPADPKAPSVLYTNWLTWNGVVGRTLSQTGANYLKIELGTRSSPGSISQVFRTRPGTMYEIRFEAATGRNVRAKIAAGDLEKTFVPNSNDPNKPSKMDFQFRATSPLTTITFGALEYEGYGPFIDRVVVEPKRVLPH
jgi:hypothetical protein